MNAWREERLSALVGAKCEQELFGCVVELANAMGFEYCAYGVQMPIPISRPAVRMFNNYSEAWRDCYKQRGYLQVDPTVRHAMKSTLPVVWSDDLFEPAKEMWEEARAHGLQYGWAQASRDASGSVGMLTLARSAEQLGETELHAKQAEMVWLTQSVHASMARLLAPKLAPESTVVMTAREKEVLRWTAEGKTASEVAQILSVSERTINFHINNVVTKLGASNKTQAAVKAAALGMLL